MSATPSPVGSGPKASAYYEMLGKQNMFECSVVDPDPLGSASFGRIRIHSLSFNGTSSVADRNVNVGFRIQLCAY